MGYREEATDDRPAVLTIRSTKPANLEDNTGDHKNEGMCQDTGIIKSVGLTVSSGEEESKPLSCINKFRHSPNTATLLIFIVLFLDGLLLTSLEPILPYIIRHVDGIPTFLQDDKLAALKNETADISSHSSGLSNSIAIGVIFAAKPLCEFVANPVISWAVDKYGHSVPMAVGYLVTFSSALGMAFSDTFVLLFFSRCLQGFGSALLVISGLAFLSCVFGDTPQRSTALALVFIGPGVGSIVGFPYGSTIFQFVGRIYPYLFLAILFGLAFLFKVFYNPDIKHEFKQNLSLSSYAKICIDPYILLTVVGWINLQLAVSTALLTIPLYTSDKFDAEPYEIGLLLLVIMIPCAMFQASLAKFTHRIGWWKLCLAGGYIVYGSFFLYAWMPSFWMLAIPNVIGGSGLGIILSSFHALLCDITDRRFGPNYGAAFGLNKIGFGIGMFTGSLGSSVLIDKFGYLTTFTSCGAVCFILNTGFLFLRNVPRKGLKQNQTEHEENIYYITKL